MSKTMERENALYQEAQMQYLRSRVAALSEEVDKLTEEKDALTLELMEYKGEYKETEETPSDSATT